MTALLLLAPLTACTHETPAPPRTQTSGPTVSAGPTTSPSPTPSASPSVAPTSGPNQDVTVEPERPEALRGPATEENAVAVATYAMALFPYTVATGDLTAWDALSGDQCTYCASVRGIVDEIYGAGNHAVGGADDIGVGLPYSRDDGSFVVVVDLTQYPSQTLDAKGEVVEDYPGAVSLRARVALRVITGSSMGSRSMRLNRGEPRPGRARRHSSHSPLSRTSPHRHPR